MRLADILFAQGFGTRCDCAALAASGKVKVNGIVHDDPDEEIDAEGLSFECDGRIWPYCERALIALNKPAGYECSLKPSAYPSVMNLLPWQLRRRGVQPIGRLDADATGLLLLTDDGRLNHRLIHPKRCVPKVYEVELKHPADEGLQEKLMAGVVLRDSDEAVRAENARLLDPRHLELTLTQGKYHQVKRMIAACGNRVEKLHRSRIGGFRLPDDLASGAWIWLSDPKLVVGDGHA